MFLDTSGNTVEDPIAAAKAFLDEPVPLVDLLDMYDAPFNRYAKYLNFDVVRCAFRYGDLVEALEWDISARHAAYVLRDLPGWRDAAPARRFGVRGKWLIRDNNNEEADHVGRLGFQLNLPEYDDEEDDDDWMDLIGGTDEDDWSDLI